jgi:hypothetical protein
MKSKWSFAQGFEAKTVNELFGGSKPIIRPLPALEKRNP